MFGKNARENVEDVRNDLECSKDKLNKALSSVEKDANREKIQCCLDDVNKALSSVDNTLSNYQE